MKLLLALGIVLLQSMVVRGEDEPVRIGDFESKAAKEAVNRFKERLAFLEARMKQQQDAANAQFKSELKVALASAVADSDLQEVERISKFLQQGPADRQQKPSHDDSAAEKKISDLERRLAAAKAVDPIVGKWRYHNDSVCEYTENGWVVLNGRAIGLWRRGTDRQYVAAFLKTFGKGVSDEMTLSTDGKTIAAIGSKGEKFRITRVSP